VVSVILKTSHVENPLRPVGASAFYGSLVSRALPFAFALRSLLKKFIFIDQQFLWLLLLNRV